MIYYKEHDSEELKFVDFNLSIPGTYINRSLSIRITLPAQHHSRSVYMHLEGGGGILFVFVLYFPLVYYYYYYYFLFFFAVYMYPANLHHFILFFNKPCHFLPL